MLMCGEKRGSGFQLNPWGGCKAALYISRHYDLSVRRLPKTYQAELKWIAHHAFLSFPETAFTHATKKQPVLNPADGFNCILVDQSHSVNSTAQKDKFVETRAHYFTPETVLRRFHRSSVSDSCNGNKCGRTGGMDPLVHVCDAVIRLFSFERDVGQQCEMKPTCIFLPFSESSVLSLLSGMAHCTQDSAERNPSRVRG